MLLLLQVVGVLAVALLLSALLPGGPSRPRLATSMAVIASVLAAVSAGSGLWLAAKTFASEYRSEAGLSPEDAATLGGARAGVEVGFVEWVHSQLRPGERFYVVTDDESPNAEPGHQWTTYRLLPNLATDHPEQADVLVFYDSDQSDLRYDPRRYGAPRAFAPGFSIARAR